MAHHLQKEHFATQSVDTASPYPSSVDATYISFVLLLITYAIFTIFVAIRYPIANNILISLLLALIITPVFWILKIIELIAGTTLDRLSNNRRRTTH